MRKLLAPAAVAVICLAVLLTVLPTLASRDAGGGIAGVPGGGTFPANLNVQDDDCEHDFFIWGAPPPHNVPLNVITQPGGPGEPDRISILKKEPSSPWVDVHGVMEGTQFFAEGEGTVAGFPNVTVQMQGTWDGQTLTGKYAMGTQGELPSGNCPGGQPQPAVYSIKPKATPTPTATPPDEKFYSIIVLKLNNANLQPLPGWEFNLYAGANCQGTAFDSDRTEEDGLIDFVGLDPGTYSVEEKLQPGWNIKGEACQDVTLAAAGLPAGVPSCPTQPDQPFPQPGCDTFLSGARVNVRVNATGETSPVNLSGPTQIERENKPTDLDGDGLDEVKTEIVFMELAGGGIEVRESSTQASRGLIEEQQNDTPGVLDFPANSFFDVFFEVDIGGVTLHNDDPFRVACKIEEIPPYSCLYQPPIPDPIELLNDDGVKVATLLHGLHIPVPPKQTLIIFSNEQKATPTRTPTSAGTPTRTPTSAGTATPTATQTPTAAPTNPPPNGECAKTGQDVPFAGAIWDLWKCLPSAAAGQPFNRVDIFVGKATQDFKLDPESPPVFLCQETGEQATGANKGHKKDVNPGTNLPHSEVWSADFFEKCTGGVTVYVRPRDPANHPVIVGVAFTNTSPPSAPTPTPTPAGPCAKIAQDVEFPHNPNPGLWDLWKCFPDDPQFGWNRVDIFVGKATQERKLRAVQFDCQSNDSKAGVVTLKGHEKDANDDPLLPHHEIWSGEDFDGKKCRGGVTIGLLPVDPDNHPVIKAVFFSNVGPPNDGDVNCSGGANSLDALIVLQHVAALLDLNDDPVGTDCPGQFKRADTDEDGDVTSLDGLLILQLDAGLLDGLPVMMAGGGMGALF